MAKLNRDSFITIAATTALTLTTSGKLIRNFDYYKTGGQKFVTRKELVTLCKKNRMDVFGMANLMAQENSEMSPFLVATAGQIVDRFEEFHRKLLFFHPEDTIDIIPVIDDQRRFWSGITNVKFYDKSLQKELENKIPEELSFIENEVKKLPSSISTE